MVVRLRGGGGGGGGGGRESVYYYNERLNEKSSTPTTEDFSFFILPNVSFQFPRQLIPVQRTLPL